MITFKGETNISFQNFESCPFVSSFILKWNADSANCINDFLEGTEVNVDLVIYRNAEVFLDCTNQAIWILLVEISVDTPLPG